ncbi:MAG: hypothetical protein KDE48_00470 [Anaerolineales bacterium]|nr:hypothetical protein [Anaerolineales bacterium]
MVVENPFYNNGRFISPSLNRLYIVDLPGFALVEPYRNQTGYDLLSKRALRQLIFTNRVDLNIKPNGSLNIIDACFESDDLIVRDTAVAVAEEYGRRLGIMLVTLKRGDDINRMARSGWDERHWALWASVNTVWLGGGLVAGHLGQIAAQTAQKLLRAAGYPAYRVQRAENAAHLPLYGLACMASAQTQAMLVADFGHTAVKRGLAVYENGKLAALDLLPPAAVDYQISKEIALSQSAVVTFAEWIVDVLTGTWREFGFGKRPLTSTIGVSMACYLFRGQPPTSEMGLYGRLQLLSDNVQTFLSDRLRTRLAQPVQLRLMHDGSAAALTLPNTEGTVVLMLGTAIGNAFPVFNP